jgi:hypothetical protein
MADFTAFMFEKARPNEDKTKIFDRILKEYFEIPACFRK